MTTSLHIMEAQRIPKTLEGSICSISILLVDLSDRTLIADTVIFICKCLIGTNGALVEECLMLVAKSLRLLMVGRWSKQWVRQYSFFWLYIKWLELRPHIHEVHQNGGVQYKCACKHLISPSIHCFGDSTMTGGYENFKLGAKCMGRLKIAKFVISQRFWKRK